MIKKILKKANRYRDVVNTLNKISKLNDCPIPVEVYIDENNNPQWRIDGGLVAKEARELLQLIYEDYTVELHEHLSERFIHLYHYIKSEINDMMHDYTLAISYDMGPRVDMETIRVWLIIDSLLITSDYSIEGWNWIIPDGWKKEKLE